MPSWSVLASHSGSLGGVDPDPSSGPEHGAGETVPGGAARSPGANTGPGTRNLPDMLSTAAP